MAQSNSINANTTGIIGNTGTSFTATPVTNHNLIIGGSTSSTLTNVAPSATSGVPVISQGAAADPTFGTAVVAGGGTGVATFANTSALICTGTTSTGAVQNVASVAVGQVLVSAGTSTLPSWSGAPSVTSITVGGGTALATYVEGTFTPVATFGGGSTGITYSIQSGKYSRVGNCVHINISMAFSSKGSSTGNLILTGLPYTSAGSSVQSQLFLTTYAVTATGSDYFAGVIQASSTSVQMYHFETGAGTASMITDTQCANNSAFQVNGCYFV